MARRTAAEAEETRQAVLAAARTLFATHGYNGVSVPACAKAAGVTHGGLYHHYPSKAALFRAVFHEVERELNDAVMDLAATATSMREGFLLGARASIDQMASAEYQQIALTDAPAVFGWDEWRAIDSQIGFPTMVAGLELLVADGMLAHAGDLHALGVLLFGALTEAAVRISRNDPDIDADAVVTMVDRILTALS